MKTSLVDDIYILAHNLNLSTDKVRKIITSYSDYCKDLLRAGQTVHFLGLCKIVPINIKQNYNTTLAYDCLQVSKRVSLPYNTVFTVIDEYLESLRKAMQDNVDVNLRGLCTLRIVNRLEAGYTIHGKISPTLREQGIEAKVSSNIHLRHLVRGY